MEYCIRKINPAVIVLMLMTLANNISAQESFGNKPAKAYFSELDSLCLLDNGKLWGVKLYGPTMFVNDDTRAIIANQTDKAKMLCKQDEVFVGQLPENINTANTSFNWKGFDRTMVMWNDIPKNDKYSRDKLLIHENWHRIQKEIGIASVTSQNSHLDDLQGSVLIKLELLALSHAFSETENSDKIKNLQNAFIIRKYRQLLFPGNNENEFERHEGMAEYTGYKLCGLNKYAISKVIRKQLELSVDKDGFANSFAYLTGPAYGFLFDELIPDWIQQIKNGKDMPAIGSGLFVKENIPSDTAQLKLLISGIISAYNAGQIIKTETEKFEEQKILISEYKQKFIESDQLIIPNNNVKFSYNPLEKLIPVEDKGVIYKTMRLTADWGILEVWNGIFRSNDWQVFIVPAPKSLDSENSKEQDYNLMLNNGWKIVKVKDGKFTLKKE